MYKKAQKKTHEVGAVEVAGGVERQLSHRPVERLRDGAAPHDGNNDERDDKRCARRPDLEGKEGGIADEGDHERQEDLVEHLQTAAHR